MKQNIEIITYKHNKFTEDHSGLSSVLHLCEIRLHNKAQIGPKGTLCVQALSTPELACNHD